MTVFTFLGTGGAFTAVKKNTYSDLPIGLEACHVGQAGM